MKSCFPDILILISAGDAQETLFLQRQEQDRSVLLSVLQGWENKSDLSSLQRVYCIYTSIHMYKTVPMAKECYCCASSFVAIPSTTLDLGLSESSRNTDQPYRWQDWLLPRRLFSSWFRKLTWSIAETTSKSPICFKFLQVDSTENNFFWSAEETVFNLPCMAA